jgi:hypothetical protein
MPRQPVFVFDSRFSTVFDGFSTGFRRVALSFQVKRASVSQNGLDT